MKGAVSAHERVNKRSPVRAQNNGWLPRRARDRADSQAPRTVLAGSPASRQLAVAAEAVVRASAETSPQVTLTFGEKPPVHQP